MLLNSKALHTQVVSYLKVLVTTAVLAGIPAYGSTFSFQGDFAHDNDVQQFNFTLLSPGTITLRTFGFGGGVNGAGDTVLAGGFESVLQVYDSLGTAQGGPLLPGPDPLCGPRNPDPARANFCQDAFGQISLGAGNFVLALTQAANLPNGNLSDGFFYVDSVPDPNFNNGFVGTLGFQGDSHFAVDISGVDAAAPVAGVPEPSSILLGASALLALAIRARRLCAHSL